MMKYIIEFLKNTLESVTLVPNKTRLKPSIPNALESVTLVPNETRLKPSVPTFARPMIVLFLLFSFAEAQLPSYEMQCYCKDEAVAKYNVSRNSIHLAVPRYLYGKYSVYGQFPKNTQNALFFVCDFSRSGKLLSVKTEQDLRRRGQVDNKNAKRSCKSEASSVWGVLRKQVEIIDIRKVNNSRYHISVRAGNRTALCDVNAQGNIYSFERRRESIMLPQSARRACLSSASRYWRLPARRISVERVKRNKYGRYNVRVQYRNVIGKCDVDRYGRVHHFKTHKR